MVNKNPRNACELRDYDLMGGYYEKAELSHRCSSYEYDLNQFSFTDTEAYTFRSRSNKRWILSIRYNLILVSFEGSCVAMFCVNNYIVQILLGCDT